MTDSLLRRAQHSLAPAQRRDMQEIRDLCAEDPVANVVPMAHVESALHSGSVPAGLWVVRRRAGWGREMAGAVWAGSNVCPVLPDIDADSADERMADVAAAVVGRISRPAALVGPAQVTLDLWGRVEPWWGPAREVRPRQVSMRIDGPARHVPPLNAADLQLEAVRLAREEDYDALLPACVHMFIGEVGYDPMRHGRAAYEDRLHRLVRSGRAHLQYGLAEGRRQVVFKAEVGALAGGVAQLQGVWVHPELRGRGLARAGLAAVVAAVHADTAPTVSLYVNDFNAPALASYDAVGFTRVGTFATVMF
ncbi:GNAT family N-acetyltransferase [Demequina sp. SO4-18]|uniref:GNAT family N-acetyltransferase n=1 Tax=Demequina sp. SO4-18 TaxID=3401026 RepID=UPI003B5C1918